MNTVRFATMLLLFWACAAHADTEATLSVDALVDATPSEIADKQADAERAREAFAKLLEGAIAEAADQDEAGDGETDTQGEEQTLDDAGEPTQAVVPREGEESLALVPQAHRVGGGPRRFTELRREYAGALDALALREDLNEFLQDHPEHREARLLLGRIHVLGRNHVAALEALGPLVTPLKRSAHPDWQPWFWAGTAHLGARDIESARQHFDIAIEKNSAAAEIWVQLAVLEQELGNHAGALQYMAIAEQLDAEYGEIYLNRGYSLEHLGRYEEAVRAYRRFLVAPHARASRGLRPSVIRRISEIAAAFDLSQSPG